MHLAGGPSSVFDGQYIPYKDPHTEPQEVRLGPPGAPTSQCRTQNTVPEKVRLDP